MKCKNNEMVTIVVAQTHKQTHPHTHTFVKIVSFNRLLHLDETNVLLTINCLTNYYYWEKCSTAENLL